MAQMQTHGNYLYDPTCPKCAKFKAHPGNDHAWTVAGHCAIAGCTASRDAEAQTAQPDRSEPVDPAEGKKYALTGSASHNYRLVPNPNGADYRVLDWTEVDFFLAHPDVEDRREPEPDPAAVEALAEKLRLVRDHRNWGDDSDETLAIELIRRGVHVEVPDA